MKIHFITPRNPESFWTFDRILPTLDKECVFPNLALPTLAGLTPSKHEVTLCDDNVQPMNFEVEADIVGITGYIVHHDRMLELIRAFKERGHFVVVGGPYATLCPEMFEGLADVVFSGEAEETWPKFLVDFATGQHRPRYTATRFPDITNSPMPRFDLLDVDRYRSMTMQFTRGCPYNCEFCDIIVMYGRRPRMKSIECALAEIQAISETGVNNIFIVDDNFIGNRKVAKRFLRELIVWQHEHDHPVAFYTEVSINVAKDDELMSLMREASFTHLFIGIESPSEKALREAGKTQNTRMDLVEAVHKIQSYGFEVMAGMIVGFDADGPDIFDAHYDFIQQANIPISMTGLLNAFPRTPLHERLTREGRLVDDTTGDQFIFTNIIPLKLTRRQLYVGYMRLLERLYDFKSYRKRAMGLILNRGKSPTKGPKISSDDLRLGWRILRDCVLKGSWGQRRLTLSMFFETALRRPSRIKDALTLAIQHKHFYEYVRDLKVSLNQFIEELSRYPTTRALLPSTQDLLPTAQKLLPEITPLPMS